MPPRDGGVAVERDHRKGLDRHAASQPAAPIGVDEHDIAEGRNICLISQAGAKKVFPNENPIGKTLLVTSNSTPVEIVGIVGDVRSQRLVEPPDMEFYRPWAQENFPFLNIAVRSSLKLDAITKLGSDEAMSVLTPAFLNLVPGFFATEIEESVRSLQSLSRMCFAQQPSAADLYLMLGYNLSVPPYVRQALLSRSLDNDDLLPRIRKPVLITHGADDAIVKPAVVDQHKASMAHAQIHVMADAGHAPFWDDAASFNRRVRSFSESL